MESPGKLSFLNCCKRRPLPLSEEERNNLALKRWRKIWMLRNILITVDE